MKKVIVLSLTALAIAFIALLGLTARKSAPFGMSADALVGQQLRRGRLPGDGPTARFGRA